MPVKYVESYTVQAKPSGEMWVNVKVVEMNVCGGSSTPVCRTSCFLKNGSNALLI